MNCLGSGFELNMTRRVSPGQYILSSVLGISEISLALSLNCKLKSTIVTISFCGTLSLLANGFIV